MDTPGTQDFECQSVEHKWNLFNSKRLQEWKHQAQKTSKTTSSEQSGDFSILTLNQWYEGGPLAPVRLNGLLDSLSSVDVDVVCLQEVTEAAMKGMKKDKRFMKKWIVSTFSTEMHGRETHGLLTLANKKTTEMGRVSRVPLNNFLDKSLNSERGLLVTEIFRNGVPIRVINVHLESTAPRTQELDEAYKQAKETTTDKDAIEAARRRAQGPVDAQASRVREAQYKLAVDIAQQYLQEGAPVRSIVAGDFNIKLESEQDLPQRSGMKDAWLEIHPDAPSYTIGLTVKPKDIQLEPPARLDRISYTGVLQPIHVETKYQNPIPVPSEMRRLWKDDVYLSDHIGVLARFSL